MAKRRSNPQSTTRWHHRLVTASSGLYRASLTRSGRVTWACIGIATGLIVLAAMVPALSRRVEQPVERVRIQFANLPQWAGPSILDHISGLAQSRLDGTKLTHNDLADTHQALLNSGFFETVSQVHRTGSDQITIDAVLVAPTAKVRDRHGTTMIDAQGHLMPRGCGVSGDVHLVTIVNPRYSRPAQPRQVWSGGDLAAAIRVLGRIANSVWIDQVESIDLSRYAASGSLVLITDNGCRIVWGSAPGDEQAMESLQDRKIKRLDHLHRLSGRIDQYHPGEIDLTDASVVIKR